MTRWCKACLPGLVLILVPHLTASIQAQDDPLAKSLGISRSIGSLPAWSQPSQQARQDLGEFIRNAQGAVLLVGHPRHGRGTAGVVSKQNRLLATNAHVADILHEAGGQMMAIVNGTATVFQVERAWYHPGIRRQVGGPRTVLKSSKPADGPVDPNCPDVAVLQLAAEGGELPA